MTPPTRTGAPVSATTVRHVSAMTALGEAKITTQPPVEVRPWLANSSNVKNMFGRVRIGSHPVVGAQIRVDGYLLPVRTGPRGGFTYSADVTIARRHVVKVVGVGSARVNGRALTDGEKSALLSTEAGFNTGYRVDRLHVAKQKNGSVLVTGRVSDTFGNRPLGIGLYTYQLTGTITDVDGKPVQGAVVVARTNDRDFWTFSSPSDANGHYISFFHASDESDADPVPLNIGVALGSISYGGNLGTAAKFARNKSAKLDIKLGRGTAYTLGTPESYVGAIYEGLVVGVTGPHGVVQPIAERWPDANGNFSMLLPSSTRGQTLRFWENQRQIFSTFAQTPGGKVDLRTWPKILGDTASRGIGKLVVPR